ncbi:ArnT family glycosyltransferase [Chryseobacterium sp. A301]
MNSNVQLSQAQLTILYLGFALVYILGLFVPLMQNDSAQHASMAMKMVLNGDYLNIYKGELPYLDKPHMHFWLAAASMKLFGISEIAYRIPALLCLVLGAYSSKKLAELLYSSPQVGHWAALIFLSAQGIILSAHDVRTDAVLTGFVVFSIWQFVVAIRSQTLSSYLLAGFGAAIAFSSKGLMTLVIISFCVFAYLLYSREWKRFFTPKLIIAALAFFLGLSPILYAYYHQFGREGIEFILLGQSVSRMTGDGFAPNNSDYIFFFHTLLWVFLPFSLALYFGVFERTKEMIKEKFRKKGGVEFLTLGGFWLVMFVFSFSKFKLPHYLNGLIPILAILTASYLSQLSLTSKDRKIRILWSIQLVVIFSSILLVSWLSIEFTGIENTVLWIVGAILFAILLFRVFSVQPLFKKYLFCSLLFSIALNVYLNGQFYPVLTKYQGSYSLAKYVNQSEFDSKKVFMLEGSEYWAFDFYTKQNTKRIESEKLKTGDLLIIDQKSLDGFNRQYHVLKTENDYRITRLNLKFLSSKTRAQKLSKMYLVRIQ